MRTFILPAFILLTVSAVCVDARESFNVNLPPAAKKVLDKRFPGWKFPEVNAGIRQYFKKSSAELNLVKGDFDGNGLADYALQVQHGTEVDDGGKAHPKIHLVALMQKSGKFHFQVIDKDGGGDFIALSKKGDKGYDWETEKNFIFAKDAIEAVYFEKAAVAYVYEKGKFRLIITSD